ncbi:filamin-binding LIM protein 1 isoform 2-T3 [Vipera latastei]
MLSDKAEKQRMVSSIFVILAPPRRGGCGGPAKVLPTQKLAPRKEGRGASSTPGAVPSALWAPPLDPPQSVEAVLRSVQPAALPVETLGPDLQKGAAAPPSSLQASEVEEPRPVSSLGWTDGQAQEEAAAPDICAFCHKGISPDALALEAMRKQYHVKCFTCRMCHSSLAGQSYYQKEGRPLCTACYQTLEKCDACQAVILHEIVWALGKGYHPECFTCVACSRQIGSDAFAVDDNHQALCLPDFYRYGTVASPPCGGVREDALHGRKAGAKSRRIKWGLQPWLSCLPAFQEVCSSLWSLRGAHYPAGREGRIQDRVPGEKLPRGLLSVREVSGLAVPGAHRGRMLPARQPPPLPSLLRLADPRPSCSGNGC